jgi:hypothetical protein
MGDKVRENRLRRMAQRQGLALHRLRRRDPLGLGYGTYWITRGATETVVAPHNWDGATGMTMDQAEKWLSKPDKSQPR